MDSVSAVSVIHSSRILGTSFKKIRKVKENRKIHQLILGQGILGQSNCGGTEENAGDSSQNVNVKKGFLHEPISHNQSV